MAGQVYCYGAHLVPLEYTLQYLHLDGLLRDLRFGVRYLAGRPVATLVIVLTLAVGIGPNVAVFSVFKALVLEPLPYPEPERLVQVWETDVDGRWRQPFSFPDFEDVRMQSPGVLMLALPGKLHGESVYCLESDRVLVAEVGS